jgi:hypothetical protein
MHDVELAQQAAEQALSQVDQEAQNAKELLQLTH